MATWQPLSLLLSSCFLIFRVTVSPAICSRWMASLRGFPFRLTLLMARIRSPTWIAPVLHAHMDRHTRTYAHMRARAHTHTHAHFSEKRMRLLC